MKIKFRYEWFDADRTIIRYIAQDDWNWRDYHAGWQAVIFALLNVQHPVHIILDFREQTRSKMPAGVMAHLSSFGTAQSPRLSGIGVIVGFPTDDREKLAIDGDGTLATKSGRWYFADDEAAAEALIKSLLASHD